MGNEALIQSIMREVLERLNQPKSCIEILVIGPTDHIPTSEDVSFIPYTSGITKSYEKVLITHLSLASLASLSLGSCSNESDEVILKALLEDKSVYLLEDGLSYRHYKNKTYNPLYAHYMQCENKLRQFGVKIVKSSCEIFKKDSINISYQEPVQQIVQEKVVVPVVEPMEVDLTHTKLLRESDIMRVQPLTCIVIKKGCIITPLAQDRIQSTQLKIKRI